MVRKKLTKNMETRLRKKAERLTDKLGNLKDKKKVILDDINEISDELKEIAQSIKIYEIEGNDFYSVYDEHEKKTIDWKELAKSFKPTKRRIKKFTTKETVKRLRTYQI